MDSPPPSEAGGGKDLVEERIWGTRRGKDLIGRKHLGDPEGERFNWMKTFGG